MPRDVNRFIRVRLSSSPALHIARKVVVKADTRAVNRLESKFEQNSTLGSLQLL